MVSPYGAGEWAPGDMEALLCGCLLVKPRPGAVSTYPLPLRAGHALLGAAADWRGLGGVLLNALEVRPWRREPCGLAAAASCRRGRCRASQGRLLPRRRLTCPALWSLHCLSRASLRGRALSTPDMLDVSTAVATSTAGNR